MSNPLEQAGAVHEPSEYATLTMDRQFTGLWTQRSPLRDADVPYLYGKFYSASRFDSLIDGINREMTARLTNARRPGSSPYNTNTFPAINSFYPYECIQNGVEVIRVLADGQDGNIYDATAGQKSTLFTKTVTTKTRFLGVNTELFFTDGVDLEKWLFPGPWQASTNVLPGVLINVGAEPGTIQLALGGISLPLVAYASSGTVVTLYVNPQNVPNQFPNLVGVGVTFSGTGIGYLDNHTYPVASIVSTTLGIFTITLAESAIAQTTISGTGSTGSGTTGSTAPTFSTTEFVVTADGSYSVGGHIFNGQQWKCYAGAVGNWGLKAPTNSPVLAPLNGTRFWQPSTVMPQYYAVLDPSGNVQMAALSGGPFKTGRAYPKWAALQTVPNTDNITQDGTVEWRNLGPIQSWPKSTVVPISNPPDELVILDSNQNLQWVTIGGTTGATQPSWATTIGTTTIDGSVTWTCLGPGTLVSTASITYSFSTHAIDGSVSNASPLGMVLGAIFGNALSVGLPYLQIAGNFVSDPQLDQIWIWRTPQGQSTLILEDQIPADGLSGSFTYNDLGIPDTSTNGGGALIPEAPAPIASSNNPPPVGMVSPCYHLGRVFAILNNTVVWSGGPDTITGNGNTAFPPNNYVPLTERPVRLFSGVTNQGPTLFIFGTTNVYCIFGTGTSTNPFTAATLFMPSVGLLGYDAFDLVGSTFYLMTGKKKIVALDPGGGYTEQGFPIGDQFQNVTTGAIALGALYNPATTFLAFAEISSADTAVYVSDGLVGWFRFSPIASPESGYIWSPRAAIVGGTSAVQAIKTSTGVTQLLIGPPSGGGPILFRDSTVNADWTAGAYAAYPAWDVKGNIVLCQSGEVAEIAHVGLKSTAVGSRPSVSLLLGEIAATAVVPFEELAITSNDPPDLPASQTLFSDRYT